MLHALSEGMPAEKFGKSTTSPRRNWPRWWRGCAPAASSRPPAGSATPARRAKQRIEALTDDLAAPPYDSLAPGELDQLTTALQPISAALDAALLALIPARCSTRSTECYI